MKSLLFHKTKISKRYPFRVKPPSLTHYNEYPLRLNLSNVTYFEVSICEEIALYLFDHIAKSSLTRPDETHHMVCCNTKQFRKEPILDLEGYACTMFPLFPIPNMYFMVAFWYFLARHSTYQGLFPQDSTHAQLTWTVTKDCVCDSECIQR